MQKCKGCGAEIRWATTEKGKAMPLNANPKNFYVERIDSADGITRQTWEMVRGYETHWATCKQAKQFKREQKNEK